MTIKNEENLIVLLDEDIYTKLKIVSKVLSSVGNPNHKYVVVACDEYFERASTISPEQAELFVAKQYHQATLKPVKFMENGKEWNGFEIIGLITKKLSDIIDRNEAELKAALSKYENKDIEE